MTEPTANPFIDDPLLMAFDALPATKLLHQSQVALLLECTTRWLEEQRSRGEPPPYMQLGDRMVRYAVGPLRTWLQRTMEEAPASPTEQRARADQKTLGFDEPILRGGSRKQPTQSSFTSFLSQGRPDHEWPFVLVGNYHRPVDAIGAFDTVGADQVTGSKWLSLKSYLHALSDATEGERAEALTEPPET